MLINYYNHKFLTQSRTLFQEIKQYLFYKQNHIIIKKKQNNYKEKFQDYQKNLKFIKL